MSFERIVSEHPIMLGVVGLVLVLTIIALGVVSLNTLTGA